MKQKTVDTLVHAALILMPAIGEAYWGWLQFIQCPALAMALGGGLLALLVVVSFVVCFLAAYSYGLGGRNRLWAVLWLVLAACILVSFNIPPT